ncbi:MAG TPA: hypothetical protein VII06_25570 [Chloroflexota bacterium]|jgi:hypothetical protein
MLTTDTATKVCALCQEPKPLEAFAKRTRSADGLQRHCKACGRHALDAADARARARAAAQRRGVVTDWDSLVARIADEADAVARVLHRAALEGAPNVLDRLAAVLCGADCPADTEDYAGEDCLVHALADAHEEGLRGAPIGLPAPDSAGSGRGSRPLAEQPPVTR